MAVAAFGWNVSSIVPHTRRWPGLQRKHVGLVLLAMLSCLGCPNFAEAAEARLGNRVVCYVTNWSQYRPGACSWLPNQLNATLCTHINFAFGSLTKDFAIKNDWNDASTLLPMTQALRRQNPSLKLLLSVGGWTHNDPGSGTEHFFSQAVATSTNRSKFANNAQRWLDRWKFDGLDIDWEYPGVPERGGKSTDKLGLSRFAQVFKAIAAQRKKSYLLTMATAATRQSNVGMDWAGLIPYVDFFSLMAYDFHGGWEMATNYHTPWKDALGGTLDIQTTLRWYLTVAKVPKRKLNLGVAAYGRTWTLADPSRSGLGAKTKSVGPAGSCTGERGILAWSEIRRIIASGNAQVRVSSEAKAAYLVRGTTWVGFDLPQTIYMKLVAAAQLELGGVMFWTADLDDKEATILRLLKYKANPGSWTKYLPGAVASSAASQGAISINPAGLYCGGGSVGNGVCQQRSLCCSQWGHCGTTYAYCSSDKAYCVGGPCRALASSPAAQAPRINNGTSWGDSVAGYQSYSAQRGALSGP